MRVHQVGLYALVCIVFLCSATSIKSSHTSLVENFGKIPLSFTINEGQYDQKVKFVTRDSCCDMFFTQAGTTISYSLPKAGDVRISVYNVLGQVVFEQNLMNQSLGNRTFTWNGKDSAMNPINSGVYLIKVSNGNVSMIRKALYVK